MMQGTSSLINIDSKLSAEAKAFDMKLTITCDFPVPGGPLTIVH